MDTVPHIRTHFGHRYTINGHLRASLHNVLQIVEPFGRNSWVSFYERTLIPPTAMGRACVKRVALYVHLRAQRAIKSEAGGFRLRDAMRTACARGAQAPTTAFHRGKVTVHQ